MANSTDLIVDEAYLQETADYIMNSGYLINKSIQSYITILNQIRQNAILDGEIAEALSTFIMLTEKLKGISGRVGSQIHALTESCLEEIRSADNFQF